MDNISHTESDKNFTKAVSKVKRQKNILEVLASL